MGSIKEVPVVIDEIGEAGGNKLLRIGRRMERFSIYFGYVTVVTYAGLWVALAYYEFKNISLASVFLWTSIVAMACWVALSIGGQVVTHFAKKRNRQESSAR